VKTSLRVQVLSRFGRSAAEGLSLKPSEYFHRNVFLSTLVGPADIASRHEVGIDRILWGPDSLSKRDGPLCCGELARHDGRGS
jgi:hypothetical protein